MVYAEENVEFVACLPALCRVITGMKDKFETCPFFVNPKDPEGFRAK
jgi:hypothetical protein